MEIIFVTSNSHKLTEAKGILGESFSLFSLKDLEIDGEIPENESTLEGNALLKANYIWNRFQRNCFADDTGLEVDSLMGAPGVLSARYAGEESNCKKNREKLLFEMRDIENRNARFRTVIALILNGKEYLFEGILNGTIAKESIGNFGFGYDPIFVPINSNESLAQISFEEKNRFSHRGIALRKLSHFLTQ